MSLSSQINVNDPHFLPLETFAQDPDTLFLYSLKDTEGLGEKLNILSWQNDKKNQQSNLSKFNSELELNNATYEVIKNESMNMTEEIQYSICKGLKNSQQEYFLRSTVQFDHIIDNLSKNNFCLNQPLDHDSEYIIQQGLTDWNFQSIGGSSSKLWPVELPDFLQRLENTSQLSFFNEPSEFNKEFQDNTIKYINESIIQLNLGDEEKFEQICLATKALILFIIKSGCFSRNVLSIDQLESFYNKIDKLDYQMQFIQLIENSIFPKFEQMSQLGQNTNHLHYIRSLCDQGGFKIAKMTQFQKQTFQTTSLTTDGTYLYIYVSATNGGMFKIGTGQMDTIAGKIYLFKAVSKQEDVSWVFCHEKLYLRSNSKELGTIEIFCPNTFQNQGMLQLHCPEIFFHSQLQIINKNFPLLSDGKFLYIIGKKISVEKISKTRKNEENNQNVELKEEQKVEEKPLQKKRENNNQKKKKADKQDKVKQKDL